MAPAHASGHTLYHLQLKLYSLSAEFLKHSTLDSEHSYTEGGRKAWSRRECNPALLPLLGNTGFFEKSQVLLV